MKEPYYVASQRTYRARIELGVDGKKVKQTEEKKGENVQNSIKATQSEHRAFRSTETLRLLDAPGSLTSPSDTPSRGVMEKNRWTSAAQ